MEEPGAQMSTQSPKFENEDFVPSLATDPTAMTFSYSAGAPFPIASLPAAKITTPPFIGESGS